MPDKPKSRKGLPKKPHNLITRKHEKNGLSSRRNYIPPGTKDLACNVYFRPSEVDTITLKNLKLLSKQVADIGPISRTSKVNICNLLAKEKHLNVSAFLTELTNQRVGLSLKDVQKRAVSSFKNLDAIGIFFTVGFGKSITALHCIRECFSTHSQAVIICPNSLVKNWMNEFEKSRIFPREIKDSDWHFDDKAKCRGRVSIKLPSRNFVFHIVPFSCFGSKSRKNTLHSKKGGMFRIDFSKAVVVIDEVHNFRNSSGKLGADTIAPSDDKVKPIGSMASYVIAKLTEARKKGNTKVVALTGTPVQNKVTDLFVLIRLLNDLQEGEDTAVLRELDMLDRKLSGLKVSEIKSGTSEDATSVAVSLQGIGAKYFNNNIIFAHDTHEYPTIAHSTVEAKFDIDQQRQMEAARKKDSLRANTRTLNSKLGLKTEQLLKKIKQLDKKFWDTHPHVESGKNAVYPKHLIFCPLVNDKDKNATTTTAVYNGLKEVYGEDKVMEFTGQKRDINMQEKWNSTKADRTQRFLVVSSVAAEGLDLKNTSFVHLMESWWNESFNQQVIARIRRFRSINDKVLKKNADDHGHVESLLYMNLHPQDKLKPNSWDGTRNDVEALISPDAYLYALCLHKSNVVNMVLNELNENAIHK